MAVGAQRGRKIATATTPCDYNSRLQKGGALLEDMRLLVRNWQATGPNGQSDTVVAENLLGKQTRARTIDTLRRAFLPRFVNGRPPHAWRIVRELEDHHLPVEVVRPLYYWITARTERLLYDFVSTELLNHNRSHVQRITTDDVCRWITLRLAACGKNWSPSVTARVARGLLAALRDFGLLEGASKKCIAPVYLPIESFAYIAFALHQEGVSGPQLVQHRDWQLFLLSPPVVEQMFLEADRSGLLRFQTAGNIVRIDFPAASFGEMADVVAARAH
ncbi:MAG TPA: BrxA family protein [Alphaproteobacteria bacterium]|nr:BrxA family protein [Alphaproteobacteria bacterium]